MVLLLWKSSIGARGKRSGCEDRVREQFSSARFRMLASIATRVFGIESTYRHISDAMDDRPPPTVNITQTVETEATADAEAI